MDSAQHHDRSCFPTQFFIRYPVSVCSDGQFRSNVLVRKTGLLRRIPVRLISNESFVFILAIASIMTIVRTLLLFPSVPIPKDVPDDFCVFRTSILGRVLCRNQVSPNNEEEKELLEAPPTFKQHLPYIFHPVNFALLVWDNFCYFRSYTFIGWMVPWLNHGFHSHVEACSGNATCIDGIQQLKSATMDSLGILQVASPILPLLLLAKLKWNVSRIPKSYPLPQLRENVCFIYFRNNII